MKSWGKFLAQATPQRIRLFLVFLFTALAVGLRLLAVVSAWTYFEFGLVAGLNLAFYFASRFDAKQAENFRSMAASCEEWRKLAHQGKELLAPVREENLALRRVLKQVGYEVTIECDNEAREIRIVVEPLGRVNAPPPKPTLH